MTALDESPLNDIVEDELHTASATLGTFIQNAARQTADELGFDYGLLHELRRGGLS